MYPIYFEQAHNQLSLNDYLQLQALLRQEQAEREHRLLQEYKKQQEQRRIQKAMHRLQVMTELYRRREQEELAIQAYYAKKKQQQQEEERRRRLIEQQKVLLLQRQQEEFYAALQRQQQEYEEQCQRMAFAALQQQQQQKTAHYAHPCQALSACNTIDHESDIEEEEEDEESHQDQLATLVKLIFGAHQQQQSEQVEEQQPNKAEQKKVEQPKEAETDKQETQEQQQQKYTMSLDQFVDYISKKAQSLDDSDHEEESSNQVDQEMEENNEDTALLAAMEHIDDDESMDEEEDDFEHIKDEQEENDITTALAIEHIDENEEEEEEIPSLVNSNNDIQELVNDILTTTETTNDSPFPDEDPVKIAKYDALSRIEQELEDIRQKHEEHVLNIALDFSDALNRSESPDSITATTAANRKFLGYEDQVMKILLKLDMIESDGDDSIRNERKNLVKIAEQMLDKLDEFKQKEWERVSCSSHSDEDM